jgi:thiosulfate/3-mercaptopyruvate sulfurtransferase
MYARPELLVETSWLDEHIVDPDVVIVDLRPFEQYSQGHIPGAFHLDDEKLVKRDGAPPYVPSAAEFKAVMESIGVDSASRVIAVDDVGGKSASRLWWALGYFGHDRVSLLNGGHAKWEGEGRAVTIDPPFARQASFEPRPREDRAASAEQVRDFKKKNPAGVLLDARSTGEFTGEKKRSRRGGHIPGAVNIPWESNLTQKDGFHVFKPADQLAGAFTKAGIGKDTPVVSYCQEGRRATHHLFALALIGYRDDGANYVGSWGEWGNRDDLPAEAEKGPAAAKDSFMRPPGPAAGKSQGKTPPPKP